MESIERIRRSPTPPFAPTYRRVECHDAFADQLHLPCCLSVGPGAGCAAYPVSKPADFGDFRAGVARVRCMTRRRGGIGERCILSMESIGRMCSPLGTYRQGHRRRRHERGCGWCTTCRRVENGAGSVMGIFSRWNPSGECGPAEYLVLRVCCSPCGQAGRRWA